MRSKLFILTFLFLFFGVVPVFAVAVIDAPKIDQSKIPINQSFSVDSNLSNVQTGEIYFVKCRIGTSSSNLLEGQTYNPLTTDWLYDTDAWTDMPTVKATNSTTGVSLQCKIKNSTTEGQKIIYTRSCLKKSDGKCGSGTSFQSSLGTTFTAIAQPTPTPAPTPKPTTTPSPAATPTPTYIPASNPPPTISPSVSPTSVKKSGVTSNQSEGPSFAWARRIAGSAYRIASVAGAQTATPEAEVIVEKQQHENKFFPWEIGPFFWVGLIFIFAGAGAVGYIYLKKNAKI